MVSPATKPAALAAGLGLALLLSAPGLSTPARADGDVVAGHAKAKRCATCHGIDGKAKLPDAPNLAGQNPIYIVAALNAYKSGARKNDMMSLVAPKLSDQDIADLAAYYASLGTPAAK